VAIVTGISTGDVVLRLATGRGAVVAAEAGTDHLGMIGMRDRFPKIRGMTGLTGITGIDVQVVLAGGSRPVVAGRTVAINATVVKQGRHPGSGTVAIVTGIGTWNVVRLFASRLGTVVAAKTGAGRYTGMIKGGCSPAEWTMAGFTILGGSDMCG